ncbi:MAG: hypothetical protein ABJ327_19380 [Litoreibacter sp.]
MEYESLHGPGDSRIVLKDEKPIKPLQFVGSKERWGKDHIPRSRHFRGGGTVKRPDLIVGDDAAALLQAEGYKRVNFEDVFLSS